MHQVVCNIWYAEYILAWTVKSMMMKTMMMKDEVVIIYTFKNCACRPPNVTYFYESFFVKSCVSSTLTFNYANEMPRSQAQVNNDVTDSVG